MGQIQPAIYCVMEDSHSHLFAYCLGPLCTTMAGCIGVTEITWLTKPKLFTTWPFTENVCQLFAVDGEEFLSF